ncbi:glycosyltransferase family 39 protein, partial [bacterium]|nr:glycosyltransferase family 39 protein [bacterium]
KAPFVYVIYAAVRLVAPVSAATPWSLWLRVASALCDVGTLLLVFALARRLFNRAAGLWAALLYGLFTAAPSLQYEAFQPEHVMVLGITGAVLAALKYAESQRLWHVALCGLLFGIGLAAKQTAAPLGLFIWAWLTWEVLRTQGRKGVVRVITHSLLLLFGVLLPWLLFAAYFKWRGAFDEYWFCTYLYNARYAAKDRSGSIIGGAVRLMKSMAPHHAFLWVTAAAGLAASVARRQWRSAIVVGGWAVCAFSSCLITGQASPYYFIQTVVPLAIAAGVTAVAIRRGLGAHPRLQACNVLIGVILLGILALTAKREWGICRASLHPQSGNRVVVNIGRYLKTRTQPGQRLYVWGSRPQIYTESGRQNACRFLYNFSYNQDLREAYHFRAEKLDEIVAGITQHKPPYIVATETDTLKGFPALAQLLEKEYTLKSDDGFQHEWPTQSKFIPLVRIFRRKAQ